MLEHPGSVENGEEVGHWYRTRGTPATVRAAFLKAAGREALLDDTTGREVEVHLGRHRQGWIGVTLWFRTADQLDRFLKAADLDHAVLPGLLPIVARTLPARHTRGRPRARNSPRTIGTIARVLAVHYLSDAGGGRRSLENAARLYQEETERAAERNRQADRLVPDDWRALGEGWRTERSRVLAELREEFGEL